MGSVREDIKSLSDWIATAFKADGYNLDYSIKSTMEIDRFFQKHAKDGKPIKGGRLSNNLSTIMFAISSYIGETIIKNVPDARWQIEDETAPDEVNPAVIMPDGTELWPTERVAKRFFNGLDDAVYPYVHLITRKYTKESFNENFWAIEEKVKPYQKQWWKIW